MLFVFLGERERKGGLPCSVWKKIQKKYKTGEKKLAIWKNFYYTNKCCDMIAVKREVAA